MFRILSLAIALGSLGYYGAKVLAQEPDAQTLNYNRDVRPILSDKCFLCHGNDPHSRQAELRLDERNSATAEAESGAIPIVPGKADDSELIRRITTADDSERMPPADSHKMPLTDSEIQILKRWITQGAEYQPHWSLIPPQPISLDSLPNSDWCRNEIDRFVLRKIAANQLAPSAEADRATLLRRLSLDLTGLPPNPEQVQQFEDDQSPDAYEKVVDSLLASPAFGEHMTRYWLDAARYGDTHGLHLDNYREIWPYRDWVIRSFNDNRPWNEFTIKQLAGDLLPNATLDDQIASGFNRLHVTTNEGGAIPEEVFVRNVVDRVSTTGTVFMGMTFGCAVCHDHKFDPITMEDFYSLYAFFNSLDDNPMDQNAKDHAPVVRVMDADSKVRYEALLARIAELTSKVEQTNPDLDGRMATWSTSLSDQLRNQWGAVAIDRMESTGGATLTHDQGRIVASGVNPPKDRYLIDFTVAESSPWLRLDVFTDPQRPQVGGGRSPNGNAVLSELKIYEQGRTTDGELEWHPVGLAGIAADFSQNTFPVSKAIDGVLDGSNGWAIGGHERNDPRAAIVFAATPFKSEAVYRLELIFESHFTQHTFSQFSIRSGTSDEKSLLDSPPYFSEWHSVGPFVVQDANQAFDAVLGPEGLATFDARQEFPGDGENKPLRWNRRTDFLNGQIVTLESQLGVWYWRRTITSDQTKMKLSFGSDDAIVAWLNGKLILSDRSARAVAANQNEVEVELIPNQPNELLVKIVNFGGAAGFFFDATKPAQPALELFPVLVSEPGRRTPVERAQLREYFLSRESPEHQQWFTELKRLREEDQKFNESLPSTLVSQELAMPRPSFLLNRGEYDKPDQERGPMTRRVPAWLPPLPLDAPLNRLGLAQWLTSDDHPLLARVTINRFWMQLFGAGLVKTAEDFGSQGSWPSHPDLLDWLAIDFRTHGWDVKRAIKMMVMSATYRQKSDVSADALQKDPTNRWLARSSRYRLDAETLRDQALRVSGLLANQIGGPGVKPPQPAGIWEAVGYVGSNTQSFQADQGAEKVHRRSLYTFWKRTAPPPQFTTLDAPSREECVIRRERTNTPLQALLLLNDPQYLECAKGLAARILLERTESSTPQPNAGQRDEQRLVRMFQLALLRDPAPEETEKVLAFFRDRLAFYQQNESSAREILEIGEPIPNTNELNRPDWSAWTAVANVILNLDEVLCRR